MSAGPEQYPAGQPAQRGDEPAAPPAPPEQEEPAPPEQGHRSGLRNPRGAVHGLGAAALMFETLVLLLAIQPMRALGVELTGVTIGVIVALALAAVVIIAMLKRPWAWHAGTVLQVLLILAGFLHWSLAGVGIMFGLLWAYVLHVRKVILTD
ncbi:DUF4233 domain-containing protein [Melissospora conviva]|uniref:DUF4233 domain-containing protein n=1 Tax=Melissospora conviva TaxID=3388432 RepID=UPI003B817F2C